MTPAADYELCNENECSRTYWNSDTVKLQRDRRRIRKDMTNNLPFSSFVSCVVSHQHSAQLWKPPRHSYRHQDKAFLHAYEECHHVARQCPSPCGPHCPGHAATCWSIPHTSRTLSPCDFHACLPLNKALKGCRFVSGEDGKAAVVQ
jgi:hypothetical protein